MSPKGVEHQFVDFSIDPGEECIHQCRRKALSTLNLRPCGLLVWLVHPSMSPKGVEHAYQNINKNLLTESASINVAERR